MVIFTLNDLPGSWDSFIQGMCAEMKWLPLVDSRKSAHKKRSSTHNKRREDGSNWRSSSHHPKKIPQAMRNMKNSTLEEPLIHLSIWIRNDAIMNGEDDEAKGSRSSLPMKQIKISIQLSFHCFVMHCLYLVTILWMIGCLH